MEAAIRSSSSIEKLYSIAWGKILMWGVGVVGTHIRRRYLLCWLYMLFISWLVFLL